MVALSSEKANLVITPFARNYGYYGNTCTKKTDNAPIYISIIIYYIILETEIGFCLLYFKVYYQYTTQFYRPDGFRMIDETLQEMLNKQKAIIKTPRN